MAYDPVVSTYGGGLSKRSRYESLVTDRSPWLTHWQELADRIDPHAIRMDSTDRNRGERSRGQIIDNTSTLALNTLAAGLMSGMTSPARPWLRLTLPDEELMEFEPVKEWLSGETKRILRVFHRSNTYLMLHQVYRDLGLFGSGASILMNSFETLIRHYNSPVGEFCLAGDFLGDVDTIGREFEKTVGELVSEFGYNAVSDRVKDLYDKANYQAPVTVLHMIEPRRERDMSKRDAKNKAWSSCYLEIAYGKTQTKTDYAGGHMLREGGYDDFPALCPRWDRRSGDIYGTSPAMTVLGDVKQLFHEQLQKGKAIEYKTMPPVQAPTSMEGRPMDMLPSGVTFSDNTQQKIETMWEVNLDLNDLREDIYDIRERIRGGMFADVFRMFSSGTHNTMTATEVAEHHEEKMLMLGPVLERLHGELLRPLVESTFARMVEVDMIARPPPELEGMDLSVEFTSVLAQAQQMIGTNGVDRFVGNLGMVAQMKPDVLDKFDADAWADMYSESLGVDPKMIIGNERVGFIREARAEAARKQEMMESVAQQASAAKDLGSVSTDQPNLATDMLNQLQGYGSPSGVDA
jgi:hypothetical protein